MITSPVFPPAYRPVHTDEADLMAVAILHAKADGEDGTLIWSNQPDHARAAILIRPEMALQQALPLTLIAAIGLGDALGVHTPPELPVTFGWPNRIYLNHGLIGYIHLAYPPNLSATNLTPWIVVGIDIEVGAPDALSSAPGLNPHQTSLAEEGCTDLTSIDLLDGFSRHFLLWINRWQDEGFQQIARTYSERSELSGLKMDDFGNCILADGKSQNLFDTFPQFSKQSI